MSRPIPAGAVFLLDEAGATLDGCDRLGGWINGVQVHKDESWRIADSIHPAPIPVYA